VRALGGDDALAQCAWSYLNDSLRLDLCCRHAAETIACAALLLAARDTQFALPTGVPWTQVFSSSLQEVEAVAERIDALYNEDAPRDEPGGGGAGGGADGRLDRWPQSLIVAAPPSALLSASAVGGGGGAAAAAAAAAAAGSSAR
jgi:hypothetical protein